MDERKRMTSKDLPLDDPLGIAHQLRSDDLARHERLAKADEIPHRRDQPAVADQVPVRFVPAPARRHDGLATR